MPAGDTVSRDEAATSGVAENLRPGKLPNARFAKRCLPEIFDESTTRRDAES